MIEKPVLFSAPMVRAILSGRKTQTRRVIIPQPSEHHWQKMPGYQMEAAFLPNPCAARFRHTIPGNKEKWEWRQCPYGGPGDLLYVRETWSTGIKGCPNGITYKADHIDPNGDGPANPIKWKPSIHMKKAHARIWLKVTDIRVERVTDITETDAKAEGVDPLPPNDDTLPNYLARRTGCPYTPAFSFLWDEINDGRGYGWEQDPWVWVMEFERIKD